MEIKPMKNSRLPRYAAALAAVAAAGMLTACRTAGEVATEGVAPAPQPTEDVQLMGEEMPYEDDSDSGCEADSKCSVSDTTCSLPKDESMVELDGDVAVEGVVEAPFYPDNDDAASRGRELTDVFTEAFAQKGLTLEPDQDYYADVSLEMIWKCTDPEQRTIHIGFFDGRSKATESGPNERDYFRFNGYIFNQKEFEWGYLAAPGTPEEYDSVTDLYALIDLGALDTVTAEQAAAIAEDILQ